MLNDLDRFHLVIDVIDRVPGLGERAAELRQRMVDERLRAPRVHARDGDDPAEIRDWTWPGRDAGVAVRVLVVNAGSSSLKLRLLDGDDAVARRAAARRPTARVWTRRRCETRSTGRSAAHDAVGHRIVHGGERFTGPVLIDDDVSERSSRALGELAPLHQPKSLAALDAVCAALPGVPAVACFDTAFHATLRAAASTYALPARWRERWGLRRFGFHGLSHALRRTPRARAARRCGR